VVSVGQRRAAERAAKRDQRKAIRIQKQRKTPTHIYPFFLFPPPQAACLSSIPLFFLPRTM
jgi:hypothetical protein